MNPICFQVGFREVIHKFSSPQWTFASIMPRIVLANIGNNRDAAAPRLLDCTITFILQLRRNLGAWITVVDHMIGVRLSTIGCDRMSFVRGEHQGGGISF